MSQETNGGDPEQKEVPEKPFHIIHSNVDGAGQIPGNFETLDAAKSEADKLQLETDSRGNWWLYSYHVFGYGRQFYSSTPKWDLIKEARRAYLAEVEEEQFLFALKTYQEWAERDKLELVLHLFADRTDKWIEDPHRAYTTYKRFEREKGNARLYIELYKDRQNDEMVHEDCLLAYGDYPM